MEHPPLYYHCIPPPGASKPLEVDHWTSEEEAIFKEAYLQYPKQFGKIATMLPEKTAEQCVLYYYRNKKRINFKTLLARKEAAKRRKGGKGRKSGSGGGNSISQVDTTTNKRKGKSRGSALLDNIKEATNKKKGRRKEAEREAETNASTSNSTDMITATTIEEDEAYALAVAAADERPLTRSSRSRIRRQVTAKTTRQTVSQSSNAINRLDDCTSTPSPIPLNMTTSPSRSIDEGDEDEDEIGEIDTIDEHTIEETKRSATMTSSNTTTVVVRQNNPDKAMATSTTMSSKYQGKL
jgi:hypothetical protein